MSPFFLHYAVRVVVRSQGNPPRWKPHGTGLGDTVVCVVCCLKLF